MPRKSSNRKVNILQPETFDEKMWGGTWEEVRKEIEDFADDTVWFYDNLDALRKKHLNRYVAVRGKKVIDSDKDCRTLFKRMKSDGMITSNVQIHLVYPKNIVMMY